jgi:hypothetical protein
MVAAAMIGERLILAPQKSKVGVPERNKPATISTAARNSQGAFPLPPSKRNDAFPETPPAEFVLGTADLPGCGAGTGRAL